MNDIERRDGGYRFIGKPAPHDQMMFEAMFV
jgi:hypothetical protein